MKADFSPTNATLIKASLLENQPQVADKTQGAGQGNNNAQAQARQVAEDFETMFLEILLKSMRSTVPTEEDSNAKGIYEGMLDSEYAKSMAASKSFGVQDLVYNWISEVNGTPNANTSSSQPKESSENLNNTSLELKKNMDAKRGLDMYKLMAIQ